MDGQRIPFCRPSLLSQDIYIKKSHLYFQRRKSNIHYLDQSTCTTQLASLKPSLGLISPSFTHPLPFPCPAAHSPCPSRLFHFAVNPTEVAGATECIFFFPNWLLIIPRQQPKSSLQTFLRFQCRFMASYEF